MKKPIGRCANRACALLRGIMPSCVQGVKRDDKRAVPLVLTGEAETHVMRRSSTFPRLLT